MTIYLSELSLDNFDFPSPYDALDEPNGLLAIGGDLNPARILNGYYHGIFPWYGPNEPLLWWSPAPRAVFYPMTFKPARSVKKFQKKANFSVSINKDAYSVINLCASTRGPEETWLNEEMIASYLSLHEKGHVHSVEVWSETELVGGLYGVQVGQLFCGESMFSLTSNASKIALWAFCEHFARYGGKMIDCQVMNPHLQSLGAKEISRESFLSTLNLCKSSNIQSGCFEKQWITPTLQD
ncbi:leucyl/phenylalanyl-tRNA--protein transferase [Vibrio sp.]|uniref:Leucyl/phenylalanyl-tRNA--protein transferase n=1 Tax=Vibrio viridaestus TaxID=2487322 RepID=A0A3N9TD34_9VIBR|nr:leucyl/phenylalanyl-tRNA--protein transferase [Vibrio viridaestus]MDC0609482.1 leucyl/phenylalanyl-tRNA--protein transferase [Vibrio sp.]RQW61960.1 leucyl/phenylalanyl-tRNA--protein transferase [Vibrio viridaestus]